MTQTRKLAAILAADGADYSRLIGEDEAGDQDETGAREETVSCGPPIEKFCSRVVVGLPPAWPNSYAGH
jgi:hypothetical protein